MKLTSERSAWDQSISYVHSMAVTPRRVLGDLRPERAPGSVTLLTDRVTVCIVQLPNKNQVLESCNCNPLNIGNYLFETLNESKKEKGYVPRRDMRRVPVTPNQNKAEAE